MLPPVSPEPSPASLARPEAIPTSPPPKDLIMYHTRKYIDKQISLRQIDEEFRKSIDKFNKPVVLGERVIPYSTVLQLCAPDIYDQTFNKYYHNFYEKKGV